jgi:hypothetical protein
MKATRPEERRWCEDLMATRIMFEKFARSMRPRRRGGYTKREVMKQAAAIGRRRIWSIRLLWGGFFEHDLQ